MGAAGAGLVVLVPLVLVVVGMFFVSAYDWVWHPHRRTYWCAFWVALLPLLSIVASLVVGAANFGHFQARRDFGTVREISSVSEFLASEPETSSIDSCNRAWSWVRGLSESSDEPYLFRAAAARDAGLFEEAGWSLTRYVGEPLESWDLSSPGVSVRGWVFVAARDDVFVMFLSGQYVMSTGCSEPNRPGGSSPFGRVQVSEFPSLDSLPVKPSELPEIPFEVSLGAPDDTFVVTSGLRHAYPAAEAEYCYITRIKKLDNSDFRLALPAIADAFETDGWSVTRIELSDNPWAVQAERGGEYVTVQDATALLYPVGCGGPVELPSPEELDEVVNPFVAVENFGENG